jgi:hypothetical protein
VAEDGTFISQHQVFALLVLPDGSAVCAGPAGALGDDVEHG